MTIFERKTRLGNGETGVEIWRRRHKMLEFFADLPIRATRMAKRYHETCSVQEHLL